MVILMIIQFLVDTKLDCPQSLYWTGLHCTTLDWTGLDWTGLDWTGLDWTGLDWTGLDWTPSEIESHTSALELICASTQDKINSVLRFGGGYLWLIILQQCFFLL